MSSICLVIWQLSSLWDGSRTISAYSGHFWDYCWPFLILSPVCRVPVTYPSIPLSVSLPASGLATPPAILACCLPPDIWKLQPRVSKGDSKILKRARFSLDVELPNKGKK